MASKEEYIINEAEESVLPKKYIKHISQHIEKEIETILIEPNEVITDPQIKIPIDNKNLEFDENKKNCEKLESNNILLFQAELQSLINKYSIHVYSNTDDFVLSQYLIDCLNAFDTAASFRNRWKIEE